MPLPLKPELDPEQNKNLRPGQTIAALILPLYFPSLLYLFAQSLLIPVLPLFASDFHIPYTLIGILLSADKLGMIAGDFPAGILARRLGIKRTMLVGILLSGASITALFWSVSIYDTFLYLFLAGIGIALYSVSRHTWISTSIPIEHRGRALSVLGGIFRVGRFAGPVVGGAVAAAFGLRFTFLFIGPAYLAAFIASAIFLPRIEPQEDASISGRRLHLGGLKSLFDDRKRHYIWAGAGYLFLQMVRSGPSIIIPLFAADVLGLDVQSIGLILSLSSAVDMSLFLPAGFIMDRWGRKISIVSSAMVLSIGIGLIPLASGFSSLLLVGLLIGFGNGLGSGTMLTLGADLAPKNMRGEFLGLWRLVGDAGSTGGPLVVGGVAEIFSLAQTSFAIAAAGVVAALVFTFIVKETLAKSSRKSIVKPAG